VIHIENAQDLIAVALPLAAGLVAWVANEWRKRVAHEREGREERYQQLLDSLSAFYVGVNDQRKRATFVHQMSLCWLYCPDSVIRAGYAFLDRVQTGAQTTPEESKEAFNILILAMRKDLWSVWPFQRTKLSAAEFRHYKVSAG
jgi:hypothetical protein